MEECGMSFFLFSSPVGLHPTIQPLLPPLCLRSQQGLYVSEYKLPTQYIFHASMPSVFLLILPSPICQLTNVHLCFSISLSLHFLDSSSSLLLRKKRKSWYNIWLSARLCLQKYLWCWTQSFADSKYISNTYHGAGTVLCDAVQPCISDPAFKELILY